MDAETEAAAAWVAAAFDGAGKAGRRDLWAGMRATVAEVRGESWSPPAPWAAVLAELSRQLPRRWTTSLGAAGQGETRTLGGSRREALPWFRRILGRAGRSTSTQPRRVWDPQRRVMRRNPAHEQPRKRIPGSEIVEARGGFGTSMTAPSYPTSR